MFRIMSVTLFASLLIACGGEPNSIGTTDITKGITASGALLPSVRVLDAAQITRIVSRDVSAIEFSSGVDFKTGDVLVLNGEAIKLGALMTSLRSVEGKKFVISQPLLDQLFSELVLNGSFKPLDKLVGENLRESKSSVDTKITCKDESTFDIFGAECNLEIEDSNYKTKLITGQIGIKTSGEMKNYSLISNTGEGTINISTYGDLKIGLQNEKSAFGTLAESNLSGVCSSSLNTRDIEELSKTGRILLTSVNIPISGVPYLTGLSIPVCFSLGLETNLSGEILSLSGQSNYQIQIGNKISPRISKEPMPLVASNPQPDTSWRFDNLSASVARVDISGKADVGLEVSLELDAFKIAYTGIQARLSVVPEIKFSAAAARIRKDHLVKNIQVAPDLCFTGETIFNFSSQAFATWPAFATVFGISSGKKKEFYNRELLRFPLFDKFGLCTKVKSKITLSVDKQELEIGERVQLNASAQLDDFTTSFPAEQVLTGEVVFTDAFTNKQICKAALDQYAKVACEGVFSEEGDRAIKATYTGDSNFQEATVISPKIKVINTIKVIEIPADYVSSFGARFKGKYLYLSSASALWRVKSLAINFTGRSYTTPGLPAGQTCPTFYLGVSDFNYPFTSENGAIGRSLKGLSGNYPSSGWNNSYPPFAPPTNSIVLGRVGATVDPCPTGWDNTWETNYRVTVENISDTSLTKVFTRP